MNGILEDTNDRTLFYSGKAYDGTIQYGAAFSDPMRFVRLEVESRGASWELEIRPMSSVPVLTDRATGKGHAVLIHDGTGGPVTLDYRGNSNFISRQMLADNNERLANEIGSVTLQANLGDGLSVIEIEAWEQGDWGIAKN